MEPSAPHRHTRAYTALGTGILAAAALTYVGLGDPHRPGFLFPPCPFKLLTGWNCPACGGLRMTHDLLHGNLSAAVVENLFLLVGLPALALWAIWRLKTGQRVFTVPAVVVIVVAAIAWTITRNLPGFPLVPTLLDR
ncbi:DUF2752 domain-containing protein [Mycobacterium sp. M26]|uniref:DUF2752 domain-containing protein n=1 Tax=Mycobacterium sp. M26 TaxID=1762962 RepID=UPI00073EC92B|nr:DUF2752 domain-containing protein [Mycobacterium sp. M26]